MARAGINKRLVTEAYEALLLKGQNPSIDSIRIEMGNTGSKTTIHRYLKEIEQDRGTRLDDEALLSETIKGMVSQLASRLHEEANNIVEEATIRTDSQIKELNHTITDLQKQLVNEQDQNKVLTQTVEYIESSLKKTNEQRQAEQQQVHRLQQHVDDLGIQLTEKNEHIQSLEDKHTHARESLEHYRHSVKEQREQDQRRHEQQIQQIQAECRKLGQEIILKQENITQLNKDNARLLTELKETRKQTMKIEAAMEKDAKELVALRGKVDKQEATIDAAVAEKQRLAQELETAEKSLVLESSHRQKLEVELARVQSEVETKNTMLKEFKHQLSEATAV